MGRRGWNRSTRNRRAQRSRSQLTNQSMDQSNQNRIIVQNQQLNRAQSLPQYLPVSFEAQRTEKPREKSRKSRSRLNRQNENEMSNSQMIRSQLQPNQQRYQSSTGQSSSNATSQSQISSSNTSSSNNNSNSNSNGSTVTDSRNNFHRGNRQMQNREMDVEFIDIVEINKLIDQHPDSSKHSDNDSIFKAYNNNNNKNDEDEEDEEDEDFESNEDQSEELYDEEESESDESMDDDEISFIKRYSSISPKGSTTLPVQDATQKQRKQMDLRDEDDESDDSSHNPNFSYNLNKYQRPKPRLRLSNEILVPESIPEKQEQQKQPQQPQSGNRLTESSVVSRINPQQDLRRSVSYQETKPVQLDNELMQMIERNEIQDEELRELIIRNYIEEQAKITQEIRQGQYAPSQRGTSPYQPSSSYMRRQQSNSKSPSNDQVRQLAKEAAEKRAKSSKLKRNRKDFEEAIQRDFALMPALNSHVWPKYIGSFQTNAYMFTNFKYGKLKNSIKHRIYERMQLKQGMGHPYETTPPIIGLTRGLEKMMNLNARKIATYAQTEMSQAPVTPQFILSSSLSLEEIIELDHVHSEIWSFLSYKEFVTLKVYQVHLCDDPLFTELHSERNRFDYIVDVFLNEGFVKQAVQNANLFNEEGEEAEEKSKQGMKAEITEKEEETKKGRPATKKGQKGQKVKEEEPKKKVEVKKQKKKSSGGRSEEKPRLFKDLTEAEKEKVWDQNFAKYMKEVTASLISFMNLKIETAALIKLKKKSQFRLLRKAQGQKLALKQKIPLVVVKSEKMEQYYGDSIANSDAFLLYKQVDSINENDQIQGSSWADQIKIPTNGYKEILWKRIHLDPDEIDHNSTIEKNSDKSNHPEHYEIAAKNGINGENGISNDAINEKLSAVHETKLYFKSDTPDSMRSELFDYQKQGLSWLLYREGRMTKKQLFYDHPEAFTEDRELNPFYEEISLPDGFKFYHNILSGAVSDQFVKARHTFGGILADQMGLGKTLMSLALIHSDLKERKREGGYGTLIVVPLPTLMQWIRQIEMHSEKDSISVLNYHDKSKRESDLSEYDVVLCPYNLLGAEFDRNRNGVLFKQPWRRLILDEAQKIKNRISSVAKGAFRLRSDYRWCLTGTPIENKLDDIFSLLHFLRVETFGEWFWWNQYINCYDESSNSNDQFELLHQVIRPLILRRTKDSRDKDGKDIVTLPPKTTQKVEVVLNPSERNLYDLIHSKSESFFKQLSADNQIQNNYIHIFQIISKLRQFCVHPSLVFKDIDSEKLKNVNHFKDTIESFLKRNNEHPASLQRQQQQQSARGNQKAAAAAPAQMSEAYKEDVLRQIKAGEFTTCQVCLEEIIQHTVSSCLHVLCSSCFFQSVKTHHNCPLCRKHLTEDDLLKIDFDFTNDGELNESEYNDFNNTSKLTGSKMMKVIELIDSIMEKKEKVVVFSQWLGTMNILQQHLFERNITFQRLDGTVNQKEKERVLKNFEKAGDARSDETMVLLASIKSAYVGLNLVAANNVILCDSWWNPAVEDQAIERVHRIGQTKPVSVWRVICSNTVEERVLELHEQKRNLISKALSCTENGRQEGAINDLKFLFQA